VNASSRHFYAQTARVEINRFRRTFRHPLGASHARAFFLSSPVVIFLLKHNNKAKNKKQIREEEKSRNPLSNDINAPSVGRNRRLDRRDDSARG
jgi:hypothetical protein